MSIFTCHSHILLPNNNDHNRCKVPGARVKRRLRLPARELHLLGPARSARMGERQQREESVQRRPECGGGVPWD